MNKRTRFKNCLAGMIGNFLEHYDSALFGLLAPFIAPLFFDQKDPFTALILTYGMLPLGLISRPLGALFFGWIGDTFGRRRSLISSLCGMALVTIGIGCLPVYKDIGIAAPLLLAMARMLQSFCMGGELAGGAIFVLEHTPGSRREVVSSCYDVTTVGGILFASALVTLLSGHGNIEQHWRWLFWGGGVTAVIGLFLRWMTMDREEGHATIRPLQKLRSLWQYKRPFFAMIVVSGFGYTTYSLAFTLMNGFIPLITTLSKTEVMQVNTALLVVDMCLLPFFGYLAAKFGKERMMFMSAVCSVLLAIPLFSLLEGASMATVIGVRLGIILVALPFAAPYYAWATEQVPQAHRGILLSLGGALGTQLIGMPTTAVCLWLYQMVGLCWVPGLYLMVVGLAAAVVIGRKKHLIATY